MRRPWSCCGKECQLFGSITPPAGERGGVFLRNAKRIVSVKYYISHVTVANEVTLQRHLYVEIDNEHTRFEQRDWSLFKRDGEANWKWLMEISERWRRAKYG